METSSDIIYENDAPRTPESYTTPINHRNTLLTPPSTPFIPRHRSRRNHMCRGLKGKITKEKITGNTIVTYNHLIRFMIFGERKLAMTTIRKDSLHYTLTSLKCNVPKSANLTHLLDVLSSMYDYDVHKNRILRKITVIQRNVRKIIDERRHNLVGPGIPVSRCVNEDCPFSLETLSEIPIDKLITWREPYNGFPSKMYGCDVDMLIASIRRYIRPYDVRKLLSLRTHPGERISNIQNPFTREGLTVDIIRRCNEYTTLKHQPPIYKSSSTNTRPRPSRPVISQDRYQPRIGRRRLRGLGARRLNDLHIDDDDSDTDDIMNVRRTASEETPLMEVDIRASHMIEQSQQEILRKLESLIPIAEAVSESFRDLEFYTHDTMFTRPIMDMIRMVNYANSGVTRENLEEATQYMMDHIYPLVQALTVGTNYAAVTTVVSRITNNRNRTMPSPMKSLIRRTIQSFRSGILEHMIVTTRNAVYGTRGRTLLYESHLYRIADMIYRTLGGILLLTHPSLREYPDLNTEDDRKCFAIVFIGSFVEGDYLGEEFSWARFRE